MTKYNHLARSALESIPYKDESLDHKYPSHSTAYACWRILPEAYLLNH